MNKGIIYEECSRYDNALDCYLNAVNTFINYLNVSLSEFLY